MPTTPAAASAEQLKSTPGVALRGAYTGTWVWHVPSDHVEYDEIFWDILGHNRDDVAPSFAAWSDRVHPDDIDGVTRALREHLEGASEIYDRVYRMRTKCGGWIWIHDRGRIVERDESGAPLLVAGTHTDVTAYREEVAARVQRDRLLEGIASATQHLVSEPVVRDTNIDLALKEIGEATGADRVYIFEHLPSDGAGRGFLSQRYEWARDGVAPQIANPDLQMLPWDLVAPRWYDTFVTGGHIEGDVKDFPVDEREALDPQGVLSVLALPIRSQGTLWGLIGFDAVLDRRDWHAAEVSLLAAAANSFGGALERQRLQEYLEATADAERTRADQASEAHAAALERMVHRIAQVLGRVVEMRDPYTLGHQVRTAQIAVALARELSVPESSIEAIETAALVHDVGKLSVPMEILNKSSVLSRIEFELLKQHPLVGYELIKDVEFSELTAEIVLHHHERLDGSGYPHGLRGDDIPLEVRIVSVSDAFEAMTSHRPYRTGRHAEQALQLIEQDASAFGHDVVDALRRLYDRGALTV